MYIYCIGTSNKISVKTLNKIRRTQHTWISMGSICPWGPRQLPRVPMR